MKVIALNMRRVYTKLVGLVYDLLASDHSSPRVSTSRPPNGLELPAPCSVRGALGKSPGHPTGALEIQQDKQARGPAKSRSWYRTAVAGSALEDPASSAGQRVVRPPCHQKRVQERPPKEGMHGVGYLPKEWL